MSRIETDEINIFFTDESSKTVIRYNWDIIIPQIGSKISFTPYELNEYDSPVPNGVFLVTGIEYNYMAHDNHGGINKKTRIFIKCKKIT